MANAGKKSFWLTRKGLLIIGVALVGVVLYSRINQPKFPPDAECGTPKIHISDERLKDGETLYYAITGAAEGRYTLTMAVSKLKRGTPSTMKVEKSEEDAGKKARILGDNLTILNCLIVGEVEMDLPYGEYTLRLWDVTGAAPKQVAETTVDSSG
ncbi:hypothetical protein [Phytomonospora endophytica]|uniref:Uncharacterized protein n=1 Tax=Phytomonospora endophytica TaxID=714109 RepID=A0A841FVE5_9ACTN|nr:hypothetical protein [Phytomonospora endophytica]MBB6039976.1 hypothetical protein [Phytomonospora endophytica]GIG69818.1 hypothetical protein Pen01_61130 [Phytomonospora endophytica]